MVSLDGAARVLFDCVQLARPLVRVVRRTKELGFCGKRASDERAVAAAIQALERLHRLEARRR